MTLEIIFMDFAAEIISTKTYNKMFWLEDSILSSRQFFPIWLYRFSAIQTKIPTSCFMNMNNMNPKVYMES